jgi:hypothetical protein
MTQKTKVKKVQLAASVSTNVADLAEQTMAQSLAFCAQKMGLPSPEMAIELLCQADPTACRYWHYGLAKEVAAQLGKWDENIKSVYVCDYDATPEDLSFCEAGPSSQVHMIAWTQPKTGALTALIETLDHALAECCAEQIDLPKLSHLLDVQVVDDAEVENRIGYGAMLSSLYNRPIQIWQR